jgi:GNAT superfamily N-acetyltransferase
MTTIRIGQVSDAPGIAQLTAQLGYELAASDAADRLSRILTRQDQQFLVADVGGRVVGWAHAVIVDYVDTERFVWIAGLVVDRDQRRQGVGRALLAQAERWAVKQGCSFVRLSSTTTRTASHRFYEQVGYTNIKTQFSFIKAVDSSGDERLPAFVPRVVDSE